MVDKDYSSIIKKFAHDAFPNLSQEYTGILYHYTSFETSQKILESNTFWLTHVRCMNDYKEMRDGRDIFYNLVNRIGKSQEIEITHFFKLLFYYMITVFDDDEQRAGLFRYLEENNFHTDNPSQYRALKEVQPNDIYLACFSGAEAEDSLPMWYMYADHGSGVCLGFDGQKLVAAHQDTFLEFLEQTYAFVTYDIKSFEKGMETFLISVANFMKDFFANRGSAKELNDGEFLSFALYYIAIAALSLKNPKFEHEKECRIFCRNPRIEGLPHMRFSPSASGRKVYISIQYPELSKSLLRRVWLGPANLSQPDILKLYFAKTAGTPIEVRKSGIPFRQV